MDWAQLAAAAFDYVENVALLLVLSGRQKRAAGIARRAALAKFALIFVGQTYVLLGGLDRARARVRDGLARQIPKAN